MNDNNLQELMKRPYALIQSDSKLMLLELGLVSQTTQGLDKAMEELGHKKENYFKEMIQQEALHLIPEPYLWRKKVLPFETYELKKSLIKGAIFSAFFLLSVLIASLIMNNILKKNIKKLEEVLNPVIKSEDKKIVIFKKNLEKYRPYISELSKVIEEEKRINQL